MREEYVYTTAKDLNCHEIGIFIQKSIKKNNLVNEDHKAKKERYRER